MTDLAAIRERHVPKARVYAADAETFCAECGGQFAWPCDAAQLLALLADTPSVEPGGLDDFIAQSFAALRRRLVGTPPNVDSIDAAIGYALNDCEAAILRALLPTLASDSPEKP